MKFAPTLHKLSNGISVILDPMDLETVAMRILFRTGSRDETESEYGITHFCEHMLCKGTTTLPTGRKISEHLAWYGGGYGAGTGNESISFHGRILAENTHVLVETLADMLKNSLFDKDMIEIERGVILDEYRRALDSQDRKFTNFISGKLFNYATFSQRNLGTEENIKSFTRDQMLDFLGRRLSARNCIIGISGRIDDKDALLKCLENAFSFLPTTDVSENRAITYTPTIAHNYIEGIRNVKLRIYFPELWPMDYNLRYNDISVGKFERYMIEELIEIVRRQNGLVYGFGGAGTGTDEFYLTGFGTETSAENIGRVVALVAENASRMYNDCKISAHDLERYWRRNRLADADFLESATARCEKLISYYRAYERIYDFDSVLELSRRVTPDDVIKYSRGYFDGAMSIMTQGAEFSDDLGAIWRENFKVA